MNKIFTQNHGLYGIYGFHGVRLTITLLLTALMAVSNVTAQVTAQVKIRGNVFGGGNEAPVKGSVTVNMTGGTVNGDVYGGGAKANTNTGNATNYGEEDETITSTSNTTIVNLQGGTIKGDAYGGGLGDLEGVGSGHSNVEAKVYGDITVNLGDADPAVAATKFHITNYTDDNDEDEIDATTIVKSGRVFGCNNLNGSPLGNVTVNVYRTVKGSHERTEADTNGKAKKTGVTPTYEVAAVYGGGNLANYTTSGKKTNVNILTCDVSVESVYGGGNAADVPKTDVLVKGAYEIGYVFGGGNGKDPWTLDNGAHWTANAGADVNGNANTLLNGGFIHEAYGGSNEKGTITGSATLEANETADRACDLDVVKLVGAGKNADIDGDAIVILGCMPATQIDQVFGGADNANVNGNVELTITSGNFRQVFGGNNESGLIKGHIKLNIEETGCRPINIEELYLGGNQAAYSVYGYYNNGTESDPDYQPRTSAMQEAGTPVALTGRRSIPYDDPELNIISCTRIGQVFGGGLGEGAKMYGNPTVNVDQIFGKAYVDNDPTKAYTEKATTLGSIGDVYGGGKEANVFGKATVNIGTTTTVALVTEPMHLGELGTAYTQNATTELYEVDVQGANLTGNVYGGGKQADINGDTEVNIGTVTYNLENHVGVSIANAKNVFGGGEGQSTTVTGDVTVNIGAEAGGSFTGNSVVGGDVYGGSALGSVNATKGGDYASDPNDISVTSGKETKVNIYAGTVSGNVFGGGLGQKNGLNGATSDIAAQNFGDATVTMKGGTVSTAIYGGANVNGTLKANSTVKIIGGTVNAVPGEGESLANVVFGGGLGENTSVDGNVVVNIGDYSGDPTPAISGNATINGHVYGGSAKGSVNNADAENSTTTKTTTTTVSLYAGTVTGDVYGGGLGTADVAAQGDDPAVPGIAALVYGDVAVKLNENNGTASVGGRIFGCNNLKGTPKGAVTVDVYGTNNSTGSKYDKLESEETSTDPDYIKATDAEVSAHDYDLTGVFGGGNLAAYEPTGSTITTVNIHGCETTSIKEVYGGGNAAPVPECAVNIDGAYEIGYVYAGGNGTSGAANVGIKNDGNYGTGNATTYITGGTIYRTFAGSNANGDIRGTSTMTIADGSGEGACALKLGDVFSYGNRATMTGTTVMNMGCLQNKVGALYGGAMNANVNRSITLNVNGGKFAKVFGGNKTGGIIGGAIKVNVEQTVCDVEIDELYGCGNAAPYTTAYTDGETPAHYADPEVNIISCTSIGAVFGGGYGADAIVTGNPKVNINMIKATAGEHTSALGTIGYVYGGGNAAAVTGNPIVNIGTLTDLSDNDTKPVLGANITGKVFGGGCSADVDGSTTVNIGTVNYTVSGDVVGITIGDDVYGAGEGNTTNVTGTATVNLGADGVGNTTLSHDIYGGSAFGSAENTVVHLYSGSVANVFGGGKGQLASGDDAAYVAAIGTKATVMLHAATITGEVYGGCNVNGTTEVAELNLLDGTVGTSGSVGEKVFGGGKGHATTTTTATVNVGSDTSTGTSSIYSNVYGGSALGAVGTAIVNLNHVTTLTGHVFGGGMGEGTSDDTKATITTSATVNQNGITLAADKDIYGGCNINGTAAATTVNLLGGTVNDVFGGGLGQHTSVTNNVVVNVGTYNTTDGIQGNPTVTGNVYGGSAQGSVNNADAENDSEEKTTLTTVHLYAGQVAGSVFGGGLGVKAVAADPEHGIEAVTGVAANVYGNVLVDLNDHNGTCIVSQDIFGCNNYNGSPKGTPEVHIYKTVHLDGSSAVTNDNPTLGTYELHAVYGGGNEAAFTGVTTKVVIETCDPSIETVYGGGNAADATNTSVLVKGAYEIGTVFGGGNGEVTPANVSGTATTVLNGGRIHDFYGGSNSQGTIGSTSVATSGTFITIDDLFTKENTGCMLQVDNIYGAGKNADVDGGVNMTMGCLSDAFTIQNLYGGAQNANIGGGVTLTVTSGRFDRVFGGNNVSGTIGGNITVNLEETGCKPLIIGQVFGGGNKADFDHNTTVNAKSFTSIGEIYGGGNLANVAGCTSVNILTKLSDMNATDASVFASDTKTIGEKSVTLPAHAKGAVGAIGYVYGGGFGASTNVNQNVEVTIGSTTDDDVNPIITGDVYGGSALGTVNGTTPTTDYHTYVTLNKGTVTGSVYGGGLGDASNPAAVNGAVTVTVNGGKAANVFGCNNVNGSPQSTVAVIINGTEALSVVAPDIKNVYGGGNQAEYTYANAANPLQVTVNGGTIGNVYGGGLSADVRGSITVSINGGKVFEDVYGGGALAHTNTANWNPGSGHTLGEWEYVLMTVTADPTTEQLNSGLCLKSGVSPVGGYYTKSGGIYTLITDPAPDANGVYVVPKAALDGEYYKKMVVGDWATSMNNASTGTTYKTTVNLMGGVVGNVYGGALGDLSTLGSGHSDVSAIVYGDVAVNLGNGSDAATGFVQAFETPAGSDMAVPTSGRLFGCNNINGTPLGNVTVTVNNTQQLDGDGKPIAGHSDNKYDVHSVYGGGNLSRYEPANGKSTMVMIDGCNITSIEKVFGGGNSAAVPQTKVVIKGSHRIGYAFGGGNGADMIKKGSTWYANDGAPVYGDATVIAVGGKIGMTFAGSDTKGAVWGTATTKLKDKNGEGDTVDGYSSSCPLKITNSYGAGRGADILTDVNFIVSGCTGSDQIENVFGGSYDAHIRGNINLTITSGVFTQVFGGNDHGGAIGGDITVNIEESESTECNPTIIQYLYGGGREAAYPGTGAVDKESHPVTRGNITVNVKSATRIDNVYGGGWRALINGDTEVNINMIKGSWAGRTYTLPEGYRGNTIPNSNMSVTYQAIPSANIEVGKTIVTGYYTYDSLTDKYEQVTEQEEKAAADVTYYEAVPTGVITIKNEIGTIGNVYGGSYQSETHGNATVNIGTAQNIDILKREGEDNGGELEHPGARFVNAAGQYVYELDGTIIKDNDVARVVTYVSKPVVGAHITGNVYGGGDLAAMDKYESGEDGEGNPTYAGGNTFVNICAVRNGDNYDAVNYAPVTIEGNVYGGGRGLADNFFCRSGMVGHEGDNVGQDPDTKDGTTVRIGNGTVNGSVYGGGEIARVEWSSDVTVGLATGVTSAPVIEGSVFGGGKGVSTHGYSALLRGDTHVTVQANAEVRKSVYGGGEIASVGRYNVATEDNAATYGVEPGMPYSLFDARTGQCHVTVQGNAVIGPDEAMTMPTFLGNVFGGGKGVLPYEGYAANENPWRMPPDNSKQYYPRSTQKDAYLKYVETLALATRTFVTIAGDAFIKGSVYGGSEEGIVQQNTLVKIKGGQIGCGKNTTDRHPSTVWDIVTPGDDNPDYECASWPYEDPYATYDEFADKYDSKGGATTGKDGHTYYGNVFGGGCGKDPYEPGEWHTKAGAVGGNTRIEITGGHILTNVYGGNELTNVGTDGVDTTGVCIITMSSGTLGVPRTLDQIKSHPVTCYLFGAGKGDQRVLFNKKTNVRDVVVSVTGGTIYGSVFGGGEDGHVMRDVTMTIGVAGTPAIGTVGEEGYVPAVPTSGPSIGTWGTSYVDGNVFGGGRGFAGDAYTAGNVAGSIDLTILGGNMLGSVYGGGRLGSVGYGLYDEGVTGYGEMRDDDKLDNGSDGTTFFTKGRGHVEIEISGGTIGNSHEYVYFAPVTTAEQLASGKANMPDTEFELVKDADNNSVYRLKHTKGGNVFAGGMGRMYLMDGTTPISNVDWWRLGNVKSTKLTISGGTIKSNVYGGSELGWVTGTHGAKDAQNNDINVSTEIIITGGTIGTEILDGSSNPKYTFGSVYGGGYGSTVEKLHSTDDPDTNYDNPKFTAGRVVNSTKVSMSGGTVKASVYGGGEVANVGMFSSFGETPITGSGNTHIIISGGYIGKEKAESTYFGGATMGNVYGGGSGSRKIVRCGLVYGNTNVNISGTPTIYHNIYGGGAYGTVGDFDYEKKTDTELGVVKVYGIDHLVTPGTGVANVTITGGIFGIDGHNNGMVFGSSRGDVTDPAPRDDYMAWVYDTHVTIGTEGQGTIKTTPLIKGSVYGSGENGHTFHNTEVKVHSGTIGITETAIDDGAAYPSRGNVYGGGCGTDTYTYNNEEHYKPMAGIVLGNTSVEIDGGLVVHNVYGAGSMGSVGKVDTDDAHTIISGGKATITVSGGTIGVDGNENGNVFGAARGDATITQDSLALAKTTIVTISTAADVNGSVFGGGEAGLVQDSTKVSMTGGNVAQNIYGGGYLGNVGIIDKTDPNNYKWTDSQGAYNKTGVCTVEVTGGKVGPDNNTDPKKGNVFGAGKGSAETFRCENAMAYNAFVTVSNGKVNGNVYGGGEIGRVENNTKVKIGEEDGTDEFTITGSVFGAGAGLSTHGYSALVRGNTEVTVQGKANIAKNVYGGGEMASVGRYGLNSQKMPNILLDGGDCIVTVMGSAKIAGDVYGASKGVEPQFNNTDEDHSKRSRRMVDYNATRYTDDNKMVDGHLYWEFSDATEKYVWEYFNDEPGYLSYLETLALATDPDVTIKGSASISGSVFGGGEIGLTKGSVTVNILGGTIAKDVYGGGALASTNTTHEVGIKSGSGYQMDANNNYVTTTVHPTTTVNLSGGVINGDAYGGGLGRMASDTETAVAPEVNGDITVKLNEGKTGSDRGCIVNRVFGCNNLNGTPKAHVRVYVFATQNSNTTKHGTIGSKFARRPVKDKNKSLKENLQAMIDATKSGTGYVDSRIDGEVITSAQTTCNNTSATDELLNTAIDNVTEELCKLYDVKDVYGGGNLAMYEPTDPNEVTEVQINGCYLTSIRQVYGGGNAASTPANSVTVNEAYEIDEVFGGGNGADDYELNNEWYENPGANVGYYSTSHHTKASGKGTGSQGDPYIADEDENAKTKAGRQNPDNGYVYGLGTTEVKIFGGTVHTVYGGSNLKGYVRGNATSVYESKNDCPLAINETYGAGKTAPVDGLVNQNVDCAKGVEEIFGGSKESDVNSDIHLKITNGLSLKRVFGGNNTSGKVNGSITVEVEENGCEPIHIQDLYAGGYLAAYSIYGYKNIGTAAAPNWQPRTKEDWEAMTAEEKTAEGLTTPRKDPRINVISASRIDNIFGGGYQATVVGDPHVNVNMSRGKVDQSFVDEDENFTSEHTDATTGVLLYKGVDNKGTLEIGTIGNIYGGGNLADIIGDTYVEIGTGEWLNVNRQREMLGTTQTITTPTRFTYKKLTQESPSEEWTYENTTTETVEINETPTPVDGSSIPSPLVNGSTVTGTTSTISIPRKFTYNGTKWTYAITSSETEALSESDAATLTPYSNNATITGHVFGGGKGVADHFVCDKAMVNGANGTNITIGNGTVKRTFDADGNVIGGNVYGGGMIGRVENNTNVTIGLASDKGTSAPIIEGNVFGAGKGVNTHGYSALVRGSSTVTVQNKSKVKGSVYGGGETASVGKYSVVDGLPQALYDETSPTSGYCYVTVKDDAEIGPDNMQMFHDGVAAADDTPDDAGHVFGAGKGVLPYEGYDDDEEPYHMNGTQVLDDQGNWDRKSWADDPKHYKAYDATKTKTEEENYFKFIKSLALATETNVKIEGNAFVKGSVYGGSENGFVQHNTHVVIDGNCQIGNGFVQMYDSGDNDGKYLPAANKRSVNRRYTAKEWEEGRLFVDDDTEVNPSDTEEAALRTAVGSNYTKSLPECASWVYGIEEGTGNNKKIIHAPHDKFAMTTAGNEEKYENGSSTEGGRRQASDGHTFYGNVFGGGSGYYPYRPGKWFESAGAVYRNTYLTIKGGHILSSVYGGNEMTDVGKYTEDEDGNIVYVPDSEGKDYGTCYVTMTGGTLGVPRTLKQIAAHPVTCYLFGAGKGDQRIFFNESTDVGNAVIHISDDARIYGSVLGGGEDGHVIQNVKLSIGSNTLPEAIQGIPELDGVTLDGSKVKDGISYPYIGTTGTSYVDGNVFGAGRGFSGDALTAGSVGGNVELNIAGGTMLGSIYGGGRLASVGIPFTYVNSTQYGSFIEDEAPKAATYYTAEEASAYNTAHNLKSSDEGYLTEESIKTPAVPARPHGHITVNITGGTIGNDLESKFFTSSLTITDEMTEEEIATERATELEGLKTANKVPYTDYEYDKETNKYIPTHSKGGNVFGGSMGRLTLLDGSLAPKWTQLGQAKSATVNISGNSTVIKSCVYGGSELGTIRDSTTVVIGKKSKTDTDEPTRPTIVRDLYGGGYGSVDDTKVGYIETTDDKDNTIVFRFTPMQWAGCVGKKSEIDIYNGWVKRNVYGGGEMASVGIFNYEIGKVATENVASLTEADVTDTDYKSGETWKYNYITKHYDEANGFALSWPYEVEYVPGGYNGDTYINIYGGRLGVDDKDNTWKDNGDIYGGSKGKAGDRYKMAFCGNVGASHINIEYPDTCSARLSNYQNDLGKWSIVGAVYGGGEDGHVMGDTYVTLKNGLIGHAMYGGGSGKGKYNERRLKIGAKPIDDTLPKENWTYNAADYRNVDIYSITAGKVYGNTHVKMEGGYVGRFVYGGGNMGSVGKGNYAGATDDYSYYGSYNGYGEHLHDDADDSKDEKLWTHSTGFNPDAPISSTNKPVTMADHFLSSGKTEVEIFGGTIGYVKADPKESIKDGLPYGSVFGGSRGESAPNIGESPRYLYSPEFFSGYVNETKVTIGDPDKMSDKSYTGPTIIGSVFGGGQDGHVRRDTHVIVNAGEIGLPYDEESTAKTNVTMVGTPNTDDPQWLHRGNVYGAGSGIGKYKFDFSNDGNIDESGTEIDYKNPQTGRTSKVKEIDFSTSAGSVTRFTKVEVRGGLIHRNVYGGGSMSSVGPPKIPPTRPDGDGYIKGDTEEGHGPGKQTLNEVIVGGVSGVKAQIGTPDGFTTGLKYNPNYGGYVFGASRGDLSLGESYGTSVWTRVKILKGASIRGNVFGGGDNGMVKQDTDVIIGEKKE